MSDNSNFKPNISGTYPLDVQHQSGQGGAGFNRVEPFMAVSKLKSRWLFGVPLKHPLTGQVLEDDTLKDIINTAASRVELECRIDVFPVTRVKKIMWDKTKADQGWTQINVGNRNIREVNEVSIRTSASYSVQNGISSPSNDPVNDPQDEGTVIYTYPLQWINMSLARKGIIDMVPLQTTLSGSIPGGTYGGGAAALYSVFTKLQYVPGFFYIKYTSGFTENSVPSIVNDLIGTYATMDVLSMLAPLNKFNSQSIGLDGASQSVSGPGNQLYAQRMQELETKAQTMKDIIRAYFTQKIFMDAL